MSTNPVTPRAPDAPGIEQAARAEHAAELTRDQAEAAWRRAWWHTTMKLAEPHRGDKKAIIAAIDTAEAILGHARGSLANRRRAGMRFTHLKMAQIETLPPSLAMEYAKAKGDCGRTLATITGAEARGLSVREFAAELGVRVGGEDDRQDRRLVPVPPVTPADRVRYMPPGDKAAVARELLADKTVTDEALADPETAERTWRASREAMADHSRAQRGLPPRPGRKPPTPKSERLVHIGTIVEETVRMLYEVLDPDTDPIGQRLALLEDNLDVLSEHDRKRLRRAVIELAARVSAWEDRVQGIAGHTVGGSV